MSPKIPTAGIILAAGTSSRFGRSKQLYELNGKLLVEWVLEAALKSKLKSVFLVLGHRSDEIIRALSHTPDPRHQPSILINQSYRNGLSESLKCGLAAAENKFPSVMFLLGDQPLVDKKLINTLLDRFWNSEKDICVPVCHGIRGNPTLFSRKMYSFLNAIEGDIGARNIIRRYPDRVHSVKINDPRYFHDLDLESDIKKFV